jgi:hypothetical protein
MEVDGELGDPNDDLLLSELAEALRSAEPISAALSAGLEAWDRRPTDPSRPERAMLTYDSLLEDTAAVRAVQAAEARMLTFTTDDGRTLEVELGDRSLVGQTYPIVQGTMTAIAVDGPAESVEVDEIGCFSLPLPVGPFRLHFTSATVEFITEWMRL